jgi:DNA-binding NtrC family response regulator
MVEDEMLIRMMVSDELREENFDVIEATSADEAMTILRSPAHVDVIVSDVRMPGSIDGIGLLIAVRDLFPTLPVIIVSGHSNHDEAMTNGAREFLRKPFALEGVVNAVRSALS